MSIAVAVKLRGQTVLATLHAKGCYQPGDTVPVIFTPQAVNLYASPEEEASGQTCAACGRV